MSIVPAPFRALWSGVISNLLTAETARRNHHEAIRELQQRLAVALRDLAAIAERPAGSVTDGSYGDIVVSAAGTVWTVANGAVDYAKLAFGAFTSVAAGLVPASGGGTVNYLRADGWAPIIESSPGWFGGGIDGAKTVSGTESLTRDMFYTTLVVPNGAVLLTAGYRIYCSVSCTVDAGGAIRRNGGNGSGTTGGTVAAGTGVLGNGTAGTNGATGSASASTGGNTQPAPLPLTGATSGAGGRGGGNGVAGTATGAITQASVTFGSIWTMPWLALIQFSDASNNPTCGIGGTGGNGSGSLALGAGGGGGAGGGCFSIVAPIVVNNGVIEARGGNGAAAQGANGGGGGGGGGGKVFVCTKSYTGTAPDVSGGTGGAGTGTFLAGADGSSGYSLVLAV